MYSKKYSYYIISIVISNLGFTYGVYVIKYYMKRKIDKRQTYKFRKHIYTSYKLGEQRNDSEDILVGSRSNVFSLSPLISAYGYTIITFYGG